MFGGSLKFKFGDGNDDNNIAEIEEMSLEAVKMLQQIKIAKFKKEQEQEQDALKQVLSDTFMMQN